MASFLYAYPAPLVFTEEEPKPGYMVFDQEIDGQYVYLSDRELGYADGTLIGAWNSDGSVMVDDVGDPVPIGPLFDSLRPIGNLDGEATNLLLHHYFMGHAPRQVQASPPLNSDPRYPVDNQPFVVTMERVENQYLSNWGWIATIEFPDPNRAPDARAIGIYTEEGSYLYTTGAFVWTDTGEVDSAGDPIFKWQTVCPPGQTTADPEPIYYALLLGSAKEGTAALPLEEDSRTLYFWEADQVIPGENWVDIGQTVTVVYSTVVVPEDINLFPIGTQVRINGVEYVVATIWAGQGFTTNPNADHTGNVDEIIWVWQ